MTTTYEVISSSAYVFAKSTILSKILGTIYKGTKIEIISISGSWAYFIFNGKNAYVLVSSIQKVVTGSVTIKYVDETSLLEISTATSVNTLTLGSYSYSAKTVSGYTLVSTSPQTITLTTSAPNQTITFKYKKILGSITINYIDADTNTNIAPTENYTNLELGSYNYTAKTIAGYSLAVNPTQSVTLTETTPNKIIVFKYNKILGNVTLKYLNSTTLADISTPETFNNLTLGTYSYSAKSISGYKLINNAIQTVTLTDSAPDVTIIFSYNKILGSVTINYIDTDTKDAISSANIYSNLELGNYTYSPIDITGYSPTDNTPKTVTLTETAPNGTITFEYKKALGSVTVNYIDSTSKVSLSPSDVYTNLNLGNYTYSSKAISSYAVIGESTKTLTLTTANPNQIINFEYKVQYLPLDPSEQNYVPYISTYYIKPIVLPGEEVKIDYYITDYYYKEYLEDDFSETFTVTVRIDGKQDMILTDMKAGDHTVSLGSFTNTGEQKFSILCTDKYGRNSHELFNFFLVQASVTMNEYVMTEQDLVTYNIKINDNYEVKNIVNLSSLTPKNTTTVQDALNVAAASITPPDNGYVCIIADTVGDGQPGTWWGQTIVKYGAKYDKAKVLTEATNNRTGLQKLLDDKKAAGYNKVKLLNGVYRIDHVAPIYIPTEFTLDMNGGTIKLNGFTGANALMLTLNNTFDSHVINGTIEGDYYSHDYSNSPNNSEWVNGVMIGGEAKYSSFESLFIKDITGYGSTNGLANSRDGKLGYTYLSPKGIGNTFKLGDINSSTGLDMTSSNRTTCSFIDITGYSDIGYLSVSIYLGYQGNPCGTWNLVCHFYDSNKAFIKSIDAYQYRRVSVPSNSKFMRVTILNESYPTNLSVQLFRTPTNCSFVNVKHDNCRCVGMAPAAMNNMLVNSCEFTRSGQSSAKCSFDAEDGWDMMQDCTFKGLNFYNNPNNEFLTCAGHNFIVDNQISGKIYIWERTRSLVIRNSNITTLTLQSGGLNTIVRHGVYRVYKNTTNGGTVANNLSKNITSTSALGGLLKDSNLIGIVSGSTYTNCTFNILADFQGYIGKITMLNCKFIPDSSYTGRYKISFNGGHLNDYYFENCTFFGKSSLANHVNFYAGKFVGCTFEDVSILPSVLCNDTDVISFENCKINYSTDNLIYYSPYAYSQGTFSKLEFTNCIITNLTTKTTPFIYAYAKPNGYCKFTNCTINLPQNTTIFGGYTTNSNFITGYALQFTNSPLPTNVIMIDKYFASNTNITVTIN